MNKNTTISNDILIALIPDILDVMKKAEHGLGETVGRDEIEAYRKMMRDAIAKAEGR